MTLITYDVSIFCYLNYECLNKNLYLREHEINFIDMSSGRGLDQGSRSDVIKTKFMHIMMIIDSIHHLLRKNLADTTIYE